MKRPSFSILCLLALLLLLGCSGGEEQRRQLEALEQQNRSGEQMLNDSLAESLVEYFDQHGDANERMRAKYILGRTYYCLGELPRALETYFEAADCADTTSADCDFAKLCRIYAQRADIYNQQVQPKSQLVELNLAEQSALRGHDTITAIECYAQKAEAYDFMQMPDSVIMIRERAAQLFCKYNKVDRANQTLGSAIPSLLKKNNIEKAKEFADKFEANSRLFDDQGNIEKGREVYYYIKGEYYLAINEVDSAEHLFRKELRYGTDLNNQIAGCKGLQKVYEQRKITDSIAKYASKAYELNDSAYSLSEMQNIQKLQASYNYNHHKFLAKQKEAEAKIAWLTSTLVIVTAIFVTIILLWIFYRRYRIFKNAALDHRLRNAAITRRFHQMAKSQPIQYPSNQEWHDLCSLVETEIPSFKNTLNSKEEPFSDMDYDICVAIRVQLSPIEISKLTQYSPSSITKIRKRLLLSIFGIDGNAEDFDEEICKIGSI